VQKKTSKLILIVTGGVIGGLALIALFIYGSVRHIITRFDCEHFNIDNIELRTKTDIPDLSGELLCQYDEQLKVKTNYFRIDTSVDMTRYIQRNKFERIKDSTPRFTYQPGWNTHLTNLNSKELYTKKGSYIGEESGNMDTWLYILNTRTREVWLELIRTKHH
jgi:hypothetical protein